MNIFKQFEKEKLTKNIAKYEMYYKISLGYLHTTLPSNELNEEIELQYALGSIYELLKDLQEEENLETILDTELKKQASMDALSFFVNENLEEVKKGNLEVEEFVNSINDNLFFNETMNQICKENEKIQLAKWKAVITDELSSAILEFLKNLEEN